MIVAILGDEQFKKEWNSKPLSDGVEVIWVDSVRALTITEADVYIDGLFVQDNERTQQLKKSTGTVLVNAVAHTTKKIGANFIRINAWPTFLQRPITEVAGSDEEAIKKVFDQLQWPYQIVPDIPGMITGRVVAMIINEAYYTLGVSSAEEIDVAMKLGTSYPYGPFEWSKLIGLNRIYELLQALSKTEERYEIAPALETAVTNDHS